jgi:enoyl-CoA hydratase/carnithine racemase
MNAPLDASVQPLVLRSDAEGIATLLLNRPAQFNALNGAMLDALKAALLEVAQDERARVVVIAGAGRAFCPGHDLKEMLANSNEAFVGDLFARCSDVMLTIQRTPQPVIAKVHGIATAAGCQLVAAADLAVAASDARFATSGINFGLFCATPGVPLSRNISRKRAFEMLITGAFIDAQQALDWGLVNRVAAPDRLDEETLALARLIMDKPRAVVSGGKAFFYAQLEQPIERAYRDASVQITRGMLAPEGQEGVAAFTEKRKPRWNT